MGLGSKKRDYVTSDRGARVALAWHMNRTNELVAEGMDREKASKVAYNEYVDPTPEVLKQIRQMARADRARMNRRAK